MIVLFNVVNSTAS